MQEYVRDLRRVATGIEGKGERAKLLGAIRGTDQRHFFRGGAAESVFCQENATQPRSRSVNSTDKQIFGGHLLVGHKFLVLNRYLREKRDNLV